MFSFLKSLFKRAPAASPAKTAPVAPPKAVQAAPPPPIPPSPPNPQSPDGGIPVPVRMIFDSLPPGLKERALLKTTNGATVLVPAAGVLPQLSTGAVRVKFSQLKGWLPPGTFSQGQEADETLVNLPIAPFVAHFQKLLPRNTQQKKYQVGEDIPDLFGERGQPLATPTVSEKARVSVPTLPFPTGPASVPPPSPSPTPPVQAAAKPPGNPSANLLEIPVSAFFQTLPPEIQSGLAPARESKLRLPMAEAETALKAGKAVFPWNRLGPWIDPGSPQAGRWFADDTLIEIPLPILIPLFLGLRKPAAPRKTSAVAGGVPDIFVSPQNTASRPAPPASAPVADPALAIPPSKAATPQEIVRRAAQTPGMIGAFVSTADGLRLADQLPAACKPEILAAFVPPLFQRADQMGRELKSEPLVHLSILAANLNLHVVKAGPLFLGALGESAAAPDWPALTALAAQLEANS